MRITFQCRRGMVIRPSPSYCLTRFMVPNDLSPLSYITGMGQQEDALLEVKEELRKVSDAIENKQNEIARVMNEIIEAKKANDQKEVDFLRGEKNKLLDEKKQLRDKDKDLRDEKKQLQERKSMDQASGMVMCGCREQGDMRDYSRLF